MFDEDIYLIQLMVTPSSEFVFGQYGCLFIDSRVQLNSITHKEQQEEGNRKKTWPLQGIVLILFVNYAALRSSCQLAKSAEYTLIQDANTIDIHLSTTTPRLSSTSLGKP